MLRKTARQLLAFASVEAQAGPVAAGHAGFWVSTREHFCTKMSRAVCCADIRKAFYSVLVEEVVRTERHPVLGRLRWSEFERMLHQGGWEPSKLCLCRICAGRLQTGSETCASM